MHRPFLAPLMVLSIFAAPGPGAAQTSPSAHEIALQPGDVVRLRVWREPDFSGEFAVHPDGTAVLPRLGPWSVTDKSPESLRRDLLDAYGEFLRNPTIEIVFLKRVNIVGEVRQPGMYTVDPTMSVTDALARAGGVTPNADKKRIVLVRDGRGREIQLDESYSVVDLALASGDQIHVPEKSWVARNTGAVASIISVTATLFAVFLR